MQPNTYLQPNTYYQVQQPPKPEKKHSSAGAIVLAVLFALIAVGLGVYILVDKLILSKTTEEIVIDLSDTPANVALSEVEIPEDADKDILKDVLAGRTFIVNEIYDQYITFKSDTDYTYSYYRTPDTMLDHYQNVPSEHNGTYTVNDKVITLSGGDTFTITGDYLVKTSDKLSTNKNTIYFDAGQLPTFKKSITNALTSYMNNLQKKAADEVFAVQKSEIEDYLCTYDRPHMTNADHFICKANYSLYFNTKDIEKSTKTLAALCPVLAEAYSATGFVKACTSPEKNMGYLSTWSNLIARVKSNSNYEITGSFRSDAEASVIVEEEDKKDDSNSEDKKD